MATNAGRRGRNTRWPFEAQRNDNLRQAIILLWHTEQVLSRTTGQTTRWCQPHRVRIYTRVLHSQIAWTQKQLYWVAAVPARERLLPILIMERPWKLDRRLPRKQPQHIVALWHVKRDRYTSAHHTMRASSERCCLPHRRHPWAGYVPRLYPAHLGAFRLNAIPVPYTERKTGATFDAAACCELVASSITKKIGHRGTTTNVGKTRLTPGQAARSISNTERGVGTHWVPRKIERSLIWTQ